jgi:predicted CopG family antitoxin
MPDSPGRPRIYKSRLTVAASLEAELYEQLKAIARRDGKTVSGILQELVMNYVRKHAKGNETYPLEMFDKSGFIALPVRGELTAEHVRGLKPNEIREIIHETKHDLEVLETVLYTKEKRECLSGKSDVTDEEKN